MYNNSTCSSSPVIVPQLCNMHTLPADSVEQGTLVSKAAYGGQKTASHKVWQAAALHDAAGAP